MFDQGNAEYKAGDYANAIGHYTEAILADRTDPTLFLNRAAAYLKLGKYVYDSTLDASPFCFTPCNARAQLICRNEDADRDCTAVLKLGSSNVKALFRRGQARLAQGMLLDAQQGALVIPLFVPHISLLTSSFQILTVHSNLSRTTLLSETS